MAIFSKINYSDLFGITRVDSEYFSPYYLKLESILFSLGTKSITKFFTVSDGNHMSISKHFKDNDIDVPYFRGQDINDFFLENAKPLRIPSNVFLNKWMFRSHFRTNDVLLSIVGTIGSLSIVPDSIKNSTGSCKIAILRSRGYMDPYYLSAFLLSKYGQFQIKRNVRGAVQTGLILKDFPLIKIYEATTTDQEKIGALVRKAIKENSKSKNLYYQATKLLEQTLGLDKIQFEKPRSYTAKFSEMVDFNRIDADYYQTKYRQIEKHIENYSTLSLISLCSFIKGFEVGSKQYTETGKLFIRVSNINNKGFHFSNSDKYISELTYNSLQYHKPLVGEILLTKDGTVGLCYVVDEDIEGIISGGIVKLILKGNSIPKEYLALVINSQFCQMQIQRECSGALILHWKPEQIRKLKIPILKDEQMKDLSDLVIKCKTALKNSKKLLEQAKLQVEQIIENKSNLYDKL